MYADYIYYTTTYIGSALTEEEFARAATRASSFLDYYTRGKAKTYTGDELKMCCCALAEQYQIIENARDAEHERRRAAEPDRGRLEARHIKAARRRQRQRVRRLPVS